MNKIYQLKSTLLPKQDFLDILGWLDKIQHDSSNKNGVWEISRNYNDCDQLPHGVNTISLRFCWDYLAGKLKIKQSINGEGNVQKIKKHEMLEFFLDFYSIIFVLDTMAHTDTEGTQQ